MLHVTFMVCLESCWIFLKHLKNENEQENLYINIFAFTVVIGCKGTFMDLYRDFALHLHRVTFELPKIIILTNNDLIF